MLSIFVSSTFSDMQAERDVIRQRVLPRLQRFAAKYGESIRIVDLRWGINTTAMSEKQATEKIMDVCFEQIDKCNGRMLCLLGNRYGWIPKYDFHEINNRYGLNLASNVSATELEIQYGILQRRRTQKAIVLIRDEIKSLPDNLKENYLDDNPRLNQLKRSLCDSPDCICNNYSLRYNDETFEGLDTFEEIVYSVLYEYISSELNERDIDHYDKVKNYFDAHIDEEAQKYSPIQYLEDEISNFVNGPTTIGVIKSDAGMGKTAFSSHFCSSFTKDNCKFFYFFCGHNADSETPLQLLKFFVFQISNYLGISVDKTSDSIQENTQIFGYLIEQFNEKVVFVIDGLNHLVCSYDERFLWLPEKIPDNVKFLITTLTNDTSFEFLNQISNVQVITIPQLKKPEKFIKHLLLANGKDIHEDVLSEALSNHKIDNYYFAKMIADALVMMDRYDFQNIKNSGDGIGAINSFILNAIKTFPKTIEGMALFLLHDFGKRIAPDIVPEVYIYIACNEGGLRAADLEAVFGSKWDDISFERYIAFLSGIIVEKENGCYDFSSNIIKTAVEKLIKWKDKKKIIKHIEKLPNDDPIKIHCCLERSLWYENYEVVYDLITNNATSKLLVEQFVGCLNYAENEITTLLKKHNLYDWFFSNVVTRVHSSQERDACIKVITNIVDSIPPKHTAFAYEYLGDSYSQKGDFDKAQQYYVMASESMKKSSTCDEARVLYKLASVMSVNSDDEYFKLNNTLKQSLNCFESIVTSIDIFHRMLFITVKHQLMLLELNYALEEIDSVQVFDATEMKLKDGWQTPHLRRISKKKMTEVKEEVVNVIKQTVDQFNQCRRDSESVFQEAIKTDAIPKIIDLFILTLSMYDVLGIPQARMERLKEVKTTLEEKLKNKFNLILYQTLGEIEYILANDENGYQAKKDHLLRCCSIWGQFISQSSLPDFTEKYTNAEMKLVEIFLSEGDEKLVDEHLSKWSQARYDFIINELKLALKQCRRYPDEMHLAILEMTRSEVADVNRIKTRVGALGDKYIRCQNIGLQYYYHLIKSCIFKHADIFGDRERFSAENYKWLKCVYLDLCENSSQLLLEKEAFDYVCVYVLELMHRMLELVSDIPSNSTNTKYYSIQEYYDESVFVLEERHKYEMQRLEKIWYGYMYAKALVNQANTGRKFTEQNYLFASDILGVLKRVLYEKEITPFNLAYPTISRERIDFDLCIIEITLATYYKDVGLLLSSAKAFETATSLALSLIGVNDSFSGDYLYMKVAKVSCLQALKSYIELGATNKAEELMDKYKIIETLMLK